MNRARILAVAALAWTMAPAASSAGEADAKALRALAASASRPGTIVRIGLESGRSLVLGSDRPFRILDVDRRAPVWKERHSGDVVAVPDGGPSGPPESVFRIQTSAFETQAAAEAERARLAAAFEAPAVVRYIPDRGSWRVRVGAASDRASLAPLLARLRGAGMKGIWIAEEPARDVSGVTIRLVDAAYDSKTTGLSRLIVVPEDGALLRVAGKAYRGIVEIRADAFGSLRAINWIELETYLRGVVPSELGPEVWPQLAALEAQAVAARTYVIANRGQFEEEGFDICATPRCQVYGGTAAEHPLSDRAIAATRGEILTYGGTPIAALYTATCGGHTEDAVEVFPEQAAPYLRGVPCRGESAATATERVVLEGRPVAAIGNESGDDATRDAALLAAAGVLGLDPTPELLARPVTGEDLRAWASALARRAGRPIPSGPVGGATTLLAAATTLARDLGWGDRTRVLLADEDVPAMTRDPAVEGAPEESRRALAYLVSSGGLRPLPDGTLGIDRPATRARLLPVVARAGEAYEALGLREAVYAGKESEGLRFVQGKGEMILSAGARPFLFSASGGKSTATARLELWPGDRVRLRRGDDGRIDFLELRPPLKGASDDRSASVYSWEVRKSRTELDESVGRRLAVGALKDLLVRRRGVSGRIVELEVVGASASSVVKGFDIRGLLDLRESLAVIEIQRAASGDIQSVLFAGKGWGHGVGLCQVGAYGMALRGADYRKILQHYYAGSVLGSAPAPETE